MDLFVRYCVGGGGGGGVLSRSVFLFLPPPEPIKKKRLVFAGGRAGVFRFCSICITSFNVIFLCLEF